ncbi:MAG: restriction endonuclease, partial [Betaproteobacteria bacterium]|nr:restriction endonuclease [Betaproteobacteria bacterium]
PNLARALAKTIPALKAAMKAGGKDESPKTAALLREVRDNTVILLYRLLFVLYAEDRNLLPVNDANYRPHSLRNIRNELQGAEKTGAKLSTTMAKYYMTFRELCKFIEKGDAELSLPAYNGGLFAPERAKLLQAAALRDKDFGAAIDSLSRQESKRIHYHDLSVQHLGAMYEQFLEQELYITSAGEAAARLNRFSRKTGGSYYTPDDLVRLVVERTVGGLLEKRRLDFTAAQKQVKQKKLTEPELYKMDSAMRALEIKVCDPAMGSGHFLVSLVDYLADWALAEISAAENIKNYQSPLVAEITAIRAHIEKEAKKGGWEIKKEQLEDRQIIRRIALKKCVYGADKNFMAVELSKLSLWLHTFTVGAPLTFLDHHLRCGDSLFGEWTISAMEIFRDLDCSLEAGKYMLQAEKAAADMAEIEALTDSDIREAQTSKEKYEVMLGKAEVFNRALSLLHVMRWLDAAEEYLPTIRRKSNRHTRKDSAQRILMNLFDKKNGLTPIDKKLKLEAERMTAWEYFTHWEAAFPGVWTDWGSPGKRAGGFDAIVGNPPWNRMKMQEVEWFAVHMPEVSKHKTQDERKKAIAKLKQAKHSVAAKYETAARHAANALTVVRGCGDYPQLGVGDINLYSLFVERALTLAKPDAFIGLLVPSGIYGDKTASVFFNNIAVSGRLHSLLDFVNSPRPFFREVHRSFKFCAFIFGGEEQKFAKAECAYFLNGTKNLENKLIEFKNGDFRRVNPNTGTAPIFRSQRAAEITLAVYRHLPILHERAQAPAWPVKYETPLHMTNDSNVFQTGEMLEQSGYYFANTIGGKNGENSGARNNVPTWPVKYVRLLDLTNDSALFRTKGKLTKSGYYLSEGSRYKQGKEICLPLYVGRMAWHFNHRANSVRVNPDNVHNPFLSVSSTVEQLQDIGFCAMPHYWVHESHIKLPPELNWVLGFRNTTNATNERTIVAALTPRAAFGNSFPILTPILPAPLSADADISEQSEWRKKYAAAIAAYKQSMPLLAANLSSFALDFTARQKMQGTSANWYIMEQLPVVPPAGYKKKFGKKTAAQIVREHVLQLTYTANDMAEFARDMGYKEKPFIWDEEKRLHLRARLDALYFILYGIEREDAGYIMDSFPIVRRKDEEKYGAGNYLIRDLILDYMNALNAGDVDAMVQPPRYD